jgi:gamma-glutamylcyclotransferase (GGCT)/AIG2-like uncharacterized protein YtfP
MTDLVFFYGTLMSGFRRPGRTPLDVQLKPVGTGWIHAALFDLGLYPAAIPAEDTQVWGEVHQMLDSDVVLNALDDIEGYSAEAWVYFYNAPLGRAERIESGNYRQHLKVK